MTFEDLVKKYCTDRCMFPDQAQAVLDLVKADPVNESMADRWQHQISDYPDVLAPGILLTAKDCALAYIDEHLPQAFFRAMFV